MNNIRPGDKKLNMEKPDKNGRFGKYGGRFVPETLTSSLEETELEFNKILKTEISTKTHFFKEILDLGGCSSSPASGG